VERLLTEGYDWLRSSKLDNRLKKELLTTYGELRGIPCVFQQKWLKLAVRFKKYPVIITCRDGLAEEDWTEVEKVIAQCGCKRGKRFPGLGMATMIVNIKALQKLIDCRQVVRITYDREVKALLHIAAPTVKADFLWEQKYTGKGIKVAVLDTGVYPHPDLIKPNNRLVGFVDLIKNKKQPYDDNGHGTHVAGCIAGNGQQSQGKYKGPAYSAHIIGIKVLNKFGAGSLSTVISGINWCINSKEKIQAICLSLGSPAESPAQSDPVCQAVRKAWEKGIVVCVAAGNEGPQEHTIASPGIEPAVITVGATDDRRTLDRQDDVVASFSSRGPTIDGIVKPDVVSPGTGIVSLKSPKAFLTKTALRNQQVGEWYLTMSGTSMATPIVAGLAAQLLEQHPEWTPDQVKEALLAKAEDMGVSAFHQGQGYVRMDK
jgi:serine protease AprX